MALVTPAPTADALGFDTPAARRLADRLAASPPEERRTLANAAARIRRDELAIYAAVYRECFGVRLDVERLILTDPATLELDTLAGAS